MYDHFDKIEKNLNYPKIQENKDYFILENFENIFISCKELKKMIDLYEEFNE